MTRAQPECGTRARYRRGCRCEPCTLASRSYNRASKQRIRTVAWVERQPPRMCGCGCGAVVPRWHSYSDGHQPAPQPFVPREQREVYAEQLLWMSSLIVGAVHDEGPAAISEAIDQALIVPAPAGVDPVQALVAVLAAQIDPDQPASARLAWLDAPLPPPRAATPIPEEPAA